MRRWIVKLVNRLRLLFEILINLFFLILLAWVKCMDLIVICLAYFVEMTNVRNIRQKSIASNDVRLYVLFDLTTCRLNGSLGITLYLRRFHDVSMRLKPLLGRAWCRWPYGHLGIEC